MPCWLILAKSLQRGDWGMGTGAMQGYGGMLRYTGVRCRSFTQPSWLVTPSHMIPHPSITLWCDPSPPPHPPSPLAMRGFATLKQSSRELTNCGW